MKTELIKTLDGSHTLYRSDLDEHYHSIHGAIQESMHVFINPGIIRNPKFFLRIFEVGFGTGLNVMLSIIEAEKLKKSLVIESIEKYPLEMEIIRSLNYSDFFPSGYDRIFSLIHAQKWDTPEFITPDAQLMKISGDISTCQLSGQYDVIYFDAFSPDKQPELWTVGICIKLFNALQNEGILLTYCVKGQVRRQLEAAGFIVEKIPGPPGKKHVLKAIKKDTL